MIYFADFYMLFVSEWNIRFESTPYVGSNYSSSSCSLSPMDFHASGDDDHITHAIFVMLQIYPVASVVGRMHLVSVCRHSGRHLPSRSSLQ